MIKFLWKSSLYLSPLVAVPVIGIGAVWLFRGYYWVGVNWLSLSNDVHSSVANNDAMSFALLVACIAVATVMLFVCVDNCED